VGTGSSAAAEQLRQRNRLEQLAGEIAKLAGGAAAPVARDS